MTCSSSVPLADARSLFQRMAPKAYFDKLIAEHKLDLRNGIYTTDVVFNMMLQQRLDPKGTLSTGGVADGAAAQVQIANAYGMIMYRRTRAGIAKRGRTFLR